MKFYAFLIFVMTFSALVCADDTCEDGDMILQVGDVYYPPDECSELKCISVGLLPTVCPSIDAPPHCTLIPQDDSKIFPDCCPTFDC